MTSVCLYFKVHQPWRLKKYQSGDIDINHCYLDEEANIAAINFAADNCYLPANEILYKSLMEHNGRFRLSFSISGTTIELLQQYRPDVIKSFRKLVDTGYVEILAETYYHSLSYLHSKKEFERQVTKHSLLVKDIFNVQPAFFRNTELIYNNQLAGFISTLGYKGILCEGLKKILKERDVNLLYTAPDNDDFNLLLRNTILSDDIAFRFNDSNWSEHPLTAEKFAGWIHTYPKETELINLFFDYETFGIHKKPDSGIFNFLEALPSEILSNENFKLSNPSEAIEDYSPKDVYNVPETISWNDQSDANCVWSINTMQNNTLKKIYAIENLVMTSQQETLLNTWGILQAADNFYYMSEMNKDNEFYKYQSPFKSGEEAFHNYNNILIDFEISLIKNKLNLNKKKAALRTPAFNLY